MARKKALGKGLDAIFGDGLKETIDQIEKVEAGDFDKNKVVSIKLNKIETNPYQPRKYFDEEALNELAASIKTSGLLSPIVVKETKGDKFYIISGERRYRAHKIAGKKEINAIIIDVTDKKMAELALIENVQREDLNKIEEAYAIQQLMDTHKLTQAAAAKALGKSRPYVANLLGLLKLDKKIINGVLEGKITYGHAKPLQKLSNKVAVEFYNRMLEEEWTVREVENKVGAYKLREAKANKKKPTKKLSADMEYAQDLIRNKLQTPIEIDKKKIIIKFKDNDHLNRILKRMGAIDKW
jgi:ParB family chromosome partitioning protein